MLRCSKKKKHLCHSLFFKKLLHRCFPVNFAKFLRTPIFTKHIWATASVVNSIDQTRIKNNCLEIFEKLWKFKFLLNNDGNKRLSKIWNTYIEEKIFNFRLSFLIRVMKTTSVKLIAYSVYKWIVFYYISILWVGAKASNKTKSLMSVALLFYQFKNYFW